MPYTKRPQDTNKAAHVVIIRQAKHIMDVDGLIDACLALAIAAVVVCRLADDVPPARVRRAARVVLAVAVVVHAGLLINSAVGDSKDIALRLEETETKLLQQMEEINYEKHNQEMVSNLAAMLSKIPGTENAELTITMKHVDVDQPPADDGNHTDEIMQEAPKPSDEAPSAMGELKQKPWRFYSIPQGHVFVLDCAGDEFTVHVRPPSAAGLHEELTRGFAACSSRKQQQQPILYDYGTHRTLFLSPPGEERVVPVPWPRAELYKKLTAATLWGEESPAVKEEAVPESFKLSPDVVLFYLPAVDGMSTDLLVSATEVVEYKKLSEEVAARAAKALTPPTILSTSFPDFHPTQ
ncbi:unnamed protein product [Urochloa decumbens]|uniref:Uncharacterized protein n=1 Tax=Urochloa decumbens TaxID=240449 RepID=A0ABC8YAT1_9POAL